MAVLFGSLLGSACGHGPPATPSATSRRATPVDSQPPYRSGPLWLCPGDYGYRGAAGQYFPPTYPSPPLENRPDRCFASAAAARGAGYRLAPPPAGAVLVGGVYLVSPPDDLVRDCRKLADRLGFAVACPGLVPAPADSAFIESGFGPGGPFVVEGSFAGPEGYAGVPGGPPAGHLVIAANGERHDPLVRFCTFDRPSLGPPTATVGGHPAWFVDCPDGSGLMSGHVALRWVARGISYVVSLHGHSAVNRLLDREIARHLQYFS